MGSPRKNPGYRPGRTLGCNVQTYHCPSNHSRPSPRSTKRCRPAILNVRDKVRVRVSRVRVRVRVSVSVRFSNAVWNDGLESTKAAAHFPSH